MIVIGINMTLDPSLLSLSTRLISLIERSKSNAHEASIHFSGGTTRSRCLP